MLEPDYMYFWPDCHHAAGPSSELQCWGMPLLQALTNAVFVVTFESHNIPQFFKWRIPLSETMMVAKLVNLRTRTGMMATRYPSDVTAGPRNSSGGAGNRGQKRAGSKSSLCMGRDNDLTSRVRSNRNRQKYVLSKMFCLSLGQISSWTVKTGVLTRARSLDRDLQLLPLASCCAVSDCLASEEAVSTVSCDQ